MSSPIDSKLLLRRKVPLSRFTTMQVGGPAEYFAEPASELELRDLLEFSQKESIPVFVLGRGSNVIFSDMGYPGLVLNMMKYEKDKLVFDEDKTEVVVSAGVSLHRFALACRGRGFAGAEFLASIPGSIGGALIMNAGYSRHPGQKNEIGDLVKEVQVVRDNEFVTLDQDMLEFSYRHSNLSGMIVLGCKLKMWRRPYAVIDQEIQANFTYRNEKQDLKHPSSGSMFKNPPKSEFTAGQLIDKAGMKGVRLGGMQVSERHGNYFINVGDANAQDVIELIQKVQQAVFDAFQILLEPEVRIIEHN